MKTSADKCAAAGCYTAGISKKTITGLAETLQAIIRHKTIRAVMTDKLYDDAVAALRNAGIAAPTREGK